MVSIFLLSFYWNFPFLILAKILVNFACKIKMQENRFQNQITFVFYPFTASKVILVHYSYTLPNATFGMHLN